MKVILQNMLWLCLIWAPAVLADTVNSDWTFGLNCAATGTTSTGSFTFSNTNISGSAGTCARTSNLFTEFTLGSYSGTGTPVSTTIFAVNTGDVLIVPPILTTDFQPIFAVTNAAPTTSSYTANWISVQWETSTATLTNNYLIGQSTVNTGTSPGGNGVVLTGQWDIDGAVYWSGSVNMPGTWGTGGNTGIYTASGGGGDLEGTVYFDAEGAGVFKTTPGRATFFFPQQNITLSTLGGITYSGIMFDANQAGYGDVKEVQVVSSSDGRTYTVNAFSNVGTNTTSNSFTDTISITSANTPANGILLGTTTRTGTGAGSGNIACIANTTGDNRVICSGQSPNNNSIPYNISFAYTPGPATLFASSDVSGDIYSVVGHGCDPYDDCETNPDGSYSVDGGVATSAGTMAAGGVALDASGNLYYAEPSNGVIRMVPTTSGTYFGQTMTANNLYTVAGNYSLRGTYSGDGGAATSAGLNKAWGVALDASGNLYISDAYNYVIRMVPVTSGTYFGQGMTAYNIYTIAGNHVRGFSGDGLVATSAELHTTTPGITLDPSGNVYFVDDYNYRVRMVPKASGTYFGQSMTANDIYTVVGGGPGDPYDSYDIGDGGLATNGILNTPGAGGLAIDSSGNLYVGDNGPWSAGIIRMVPVNSGTYFGESMTANDIYTITATDGVMGPEGIAVDASGNLYISAEMIDWFEMVPAVSGTYFGQSLTANNMYEIVGNGEWGEYSGDGAPAINAGISSPTGIAVDPSGNLYISVNGSIRGVLH